MINKHRRRRRALATGYFILGVLAIASSVVLGQMPANPVGWAVLASFALAFALMSYRSVEANDRLLVNASVMVVFSAGIVFSFRLFGEAAAVGALFPMTVISASGFLSAGDVRSRRLFLLPSNLGQLATSGFVAGAAIDLVLSPGSALTLRRAVPFVGVLGSPEALSSGSLLLILFAGAAGALVYGLVNFVLVRMAVLILYGARVLQPWSQMPFLMSIEVVQGVIGAMLGALLAAAPTASFVPLVLLVYVIGQMVFTSYSALRAAHENTLRGFVKTLEARDLYTRGHTERVAEFARRIGEELGFSGTLLEKMRWAALIHDVGKLAVPTEIIRKQGRLTDDEYRRLRSATHVVDDLLSEVSFLEPMVRICSEVHPRLAGEDFGQEHHTHSTEPTVEQAVLAVADAFDAMTSTRSYRMAMSQRAALERMETSDDPLFLPRAVAALKTSLDRAGDRYGPPELSKSAVSAPAEESVDV